MQQAALVDRQVEVDERVVPAEVAQDLRQAGEGEIVRDADAQPPARPVTAEVGRGLLGGGDDVAREPGHRLAVGRQRYRVRVPQHQRPPDLPLKAADVLAYGRLLDAQPDRGAREAARLLDGEERLEQLRVISGHKVS